MKYILLSLLTMWLLTTCDAPPSADVIILGGKIYTVNEAQPQVEAVGIRGDKIIFVGSEAEARSMTGKNTRIIDLKGKILTPGFIEGHAHIMGIGYNELELDLMNVSNYEQLIAKVKEAVEKAKPGQWIIGRGWHQDKWDTKPSTTVKGFPVHGELSNVSPENPVFLEHASGHAALANSKAMEIAGVNQLAKEMLLDFNSDDGEIIRDQLNNPTGIFNERAMTLIERHIPKRSEESDRQALTLAMASCLKNGITSFHDAGAMRESIRLFQTLNESGKLKVRFYVMVTGFDRDLVYEWLEKGPLINQEGFLTIRSIKLNCDGALGSRGAWLLEPYTDRHDFHGMPTLAMDTVLKTSREALKNGFQVCSHAIGDRANREILNRYETAFKEHPEIKDHRFRIEHAQHLHPDDILRFAELGVLPAMQAIHMSSDRPWAIERLGEKRIKEGAYMWQALLQSGSKIINGTDAPVEPLNPIPSFYASVTRKTLKGEPDEGYEPQQKMTREQALRSYTLDAAFGAFEENVKGSIEVGKLADFTVFNQDIMTIDEADILKTEVALTIVGGKILYEKK